MLRSKLNNPFVLAILLAIHIGAIALLVSCGCDNSTANISTYNCPIVAMKDTGILYYKAERRLAPYYSSNGKLCKLVDGKIVEID
jgi:hypothetical protein